MSPGVCVHTADGNGWPSSSSLISSTRLGGISTVNPPLTLTWPPDQAEWEHQPFFLPAGTGLEVWCGCRDIASLDEDGYCKIIGRCKDMIIRGGENIYPAEIEQFLHTHPKVEEVQVSGKAVGWLSSDGSCGGKATQSC